MKVIITFLTALTCLLCHPAVALETSASGKVLSVYTKPSRNGVYFTHENMVSDGCTATSHLLLSADSVLFKETYSLLLSAYVSGKPVKIIVSGCQAAYNYSLITNVIAE